MGSLNPTPQTAEMTLRLGASEGAHRVSRREVDRRRGRRKLQQICCTRLRLFLGEDESIAYVAGEKLHSGFPVYQRDPASGRIDGMPAADLYPQLTTLFRWSGGSWSEFPVFDGRTWSDAACAALVALVVGGADSASGEAHSQRPLLCMDAEVSERCWTMQVQKCQYCLGGGDTLSVMMKVQCMLYLSSHAAAREPERSAVTLCDPR